MPRKIAPTPQIVFILGSGFSKSLSNIPIQKDFMKEVFKGKPNKKGKNWKQIIIETIIEGNKEKRLPIATEKAFLDACDDIEYLMSYIYQGDVNVRKKNNEKSDNKTNPYKNANEIVRVALNEYLITKNIIKLKDNKCNCAEIKFKNIINNIDNKNIAFITTNYDLVLEAALSSYCSFKEIDYYLDERKRPGIPVLKLHGSVNWLENRFVFSEAKELVACKVTKFKVDSDEKKAAIFDLDMWGGSGYYLVQKKKGNPAQICVWDKAVFEDKKIINKIRMILKDNENEDKDKDKDKDYKSFDELKKECSELGEKPLKEYLKNNKLARFKLTPNKKYGFWYYRKPGLKSILLPITIPFYFQKEDWYSQRWGDLFNRIKSKAEEILENCRVIVFIGYGFPAADYYLMKLFAEWNINKKYIINIGLSNEMFSKKGINVRYITGKYLEKLTKRDITKLLNNINENIREINK